MARSDSNSRRRSRKVDLQEVQAGLHVEYQGGGTAGVAANAATEHAELSPHAEIAEFAALPGYLRYQFRFLYGRWRVRRSRLGAHGDRGQEQQGHRGMSRSPRVRAP